MKTLIRAWVHGTKSIFQLVPSGYSLFKLAEP